MTNYLTSKEHLQALAQKNRQYTDDKQSETINILTEAFQVAGGNSYVIPIAGGSLPIASASSLGMIKVGSGLEMDGDTLNVVWNNFAIGSDSSTVNGAFWLEDD